MTPPADTTLTEEELEVARILRKLPKLVLDADARRFPDFLRWGTRRRRSVLGDDDGDSSLFPLLPPPPAPISPPPDGNDERKEGTRSGGATSSPATPLSFPASGGEEPDSRPPRPPCSSVKAFKNPKRHEEWVKEQSQLITSLSDQKLHIQRSISEYNALYKELKARNSWLRDLQSKAVREAMEEAGKRRTLRQDGSLGLTPVGSTSLLSPATRSMVDPHHPIYRWETGRAVRPPPVDRVAVGGSPPPPPAAAAAARREWGTEKWASLDLNARPEEEKWGMEEEGWEQLQSSAYKAAMSAQARKRRLEIQREKNSYSSSSTLFSKNHKMPRLS